jgi:hypothetical protein
MQRLLFARNINALVAIWIAANQGGIPQKKLIVNPNAAGDVGWSNPINIADCCARTGNGHAAAAPPSSDMNARRLMSNKGPPSRAG